MVHPLRCVDTSELGKIFSVLASLEASVPLFAGSLTNTQHLHKRPPAPLFTFVYNSTLETFPGAVFLVQAGLFVLASAIFVYIYLLITKGADRDFTVLEEEPEQDYTVRPLLDFCSPSCHQGGYTQAGEQLTGYLGDQH